MERAGSVGSESPALVVAAKLGVPTPRPETIVRERLVALLDEASARPLTVVCAGAGYGKTTAVATWLATIDGPGAWVSLDPLDNDPLRLCGHLLAALDGALPEAMAEARQALHGGSDLLEVVVPLVASALAERVHERLIVVLDDYHVVESPECHTIAAALVDALPVTVRMIVCSRTVPPLRIARRRALGTVARLGARDLAFQDEESERLLNGSLALGLGPGVVEAIEARVEGWPAGLGLIASSLAERPDRTSYLRGLAERHTHVAGTEVAAYLVEEVLDLAEPRLREFLCRTSILRRLSGPLCAAVLDDPAAHERLAEVRRSNLFVTVLDDEPGGEWLRYHHLFAELLQRELHAASPELVAVLHRRASQWFADYGLLEEAVAHATAAGDGERAAALLYDGWPKLMEQWRFVTLRRMIAQLPPDRGELAGFCEALDTVCWSLEGADMRLVEQRLDALEPYREAPGVAPIIDRSRVSPFYGDVSRAVKDGWAAWERYPDIRSELSGQFGQVLWFAGDGNAAQDIIEPYLYEIKRPAARNWAFGTLALVAAGDGDLELAESHGRRAVEATSLPAGRGALASHFAHTALAEALRLRGALDEAEEQLTHAARLTNTRPTSFYHAFTLVFEAQLALARRERHRAGARARAARAILDRYPDPGTLTDRLAAVEAAVDHRAEEELRGTEPTDAERRVLALLPSELTLEEIAEQLYLSAHTVRSHRRRLYRRLGAASREHAVAVAQERGLL